MPSNVDFLDVNVWIALALTNHENHSTAVDYWYRGSRESLAFCRQTSLALIRLLTQPAVTRGYPLSLAEAWDAYRIFAQLPDVVFLPEPKNCEPLLGKWALSKLAKPKLWTDAYLAAFARAGSLRLVSFDNDFKKFPELDFLHLEES